MDTYTFIPTFGNHFRRLLIATVILGLIMSVALVPLTYEAVTPSVSNQGPGVGQSDPSLPADVPADWWGATQEDIRQSEYQVTWQDHTYLSNIPSSYQAPNRAHNLRTYFTPDGIRVIPR